MIRLLLVSAAALAIAACSTPAPERMPAPPADPDPVVVQHEPLSEVGNHSPYRVHGRTYHVLPTSQGYVERGIASWYGEPFHGRRTSNQEVYDMYQMTAAHKTLPLPTYAEVIHLESGERIVVRINDRGPFKDGRIIDLSYAAAKALNMVDAGTAQVEVRAIVPEGTVSDRPLVETAEHLYLQLGAFSSRENALTLINRLRGVEGMPRPEVVAERRGDGEVHRVRIGPLANTDHADALIAELMLLGLDRPIVIFR
ncbi:MAG: septal ring lytic transglycosylase RlpA family protein [Pseudomonadota bacterium]